MEIYDRSWRSTLLFKARTNSLEVNEREKNWGAERETCEGCGREDENDTPHIVTKKTIISIMV